jgi:hypothetical protein
LPARFEELYAAIRVRAGVPPVSLRADRRLVARAEILNLIPDVGDRVGRGAGGVWRLDRAAMVGEYASAEY